jgi:hypothetical protein
LSAVFFLAACGGGGDGDGGGSPTIPAPSGLSYPSPHVFVVSQAITPVNPTVSGTVTSYSVSPALPAGLVIDGATGRISGTPTAPAATTTYTVTASNSGGSTNAGISVTVNDIAPVIGYERSSYSLTTDVPAPSITPTHSGGTATWSISEPLPAGLTFSTTNGSITGTPTETSPAKEYVITAQNSGGADTATLSIEVTSGVLIDLVHADTMLSIYRGSNRFVTTDTSGHWVLWNSATNAVIAQGDGDCLRAGCEDPVLFAGSTILEQTATQLRTYDATDGSLIATVDTPSGWVVLASDGSYMAVGTQTEVKAWSRSGTLLFTHAGDYRGAAPFAAPSELRIGSRATGADRVEKITVSTGAVTTVQHSGSFHSWFTGGDRFLTKASTTVWVYDTDANQLDIRALPTIENLTGQGEWFWTFSNQQLDVYEVGASMTPAASYTFTPASSGFRAVPSAQTIGVFNKDTISIVDLSGPTPTKVDHPNTLKQARTAYASISNSEWLSGAVSGLVAKESSAPSTATYLTRGGSLSIAANAERIVIATAVGEILYFDAETHALEGTIDFLANEVQLSADGSVLGAWTNQGTDSTIRFYSLPSENVLLTLPYTASAYPRPLSFSLAASGTVFSRLLVNNSTHTREVVRISDGAVLWSDPVPGGWWLETEQPIRLSPSGTRYAASTEGRTVQSATNIYVNGTLQTAANGWALGWLDDDRLLVIPFVSTRDPGPQYKGTVIVNTSGQVSPLIALPNLTEFQVVSSDRIYSRGRNAIYSVTDGSLLWSSPNVATGGGVTATHVIFAFGSTVRAEAY